MGGKNIQLEILSQEPQAQTQTREYMQAIQKPLTQYM